jgi:hypothetical protein
MKKLILVILVSLGWLFLNAELRDAVKINYEHCQLTNNI